MGWQRSPVAVKRRSGHRRLVLVLVLLVVIAAVSGAGYMFIRKQSSKTSSTNRSAESKAQIPGLPAEQQTTQSNSETSSKSIRLIATGDSIAHDAINGAAKQADGSYSYVSMLSGLKPILNKADVRFCNQSTQVGGEQIKVSGYPDFNAPFSFAADLVSSGCNLVNTASNHSSDRGKLAIDANVDFWSKQKGLLAVSGQFASPVDHDTVRYFELKGLKCAFLAYTTYTNHAPPTDYSVGMYSRDYATKQITAAKAAGAKLIIVSMRWGTEYSQGVNAYQNSESQFLADQGVQLVLGHGPHVLEPVKRLKGTVGNETLVWYSLGNFLHAQLEPETLINGVAVMDIDRSSGAVTNAAFLPTYMHYDWTADQAARQDLLSRRNFSLVPLESADELFAKSQLKTTITAQKDRIKSTLNTYMTIPLIDVKDL